MSFPQNQNINLMCFGLLGVRDKRWGDKELDKMIYKFIAKSSVYKEIINIKWLQGIDLPDVKSHFKITVIKTACWDGCAYSPAQLAACVSMASGSLEGGQLELPRPKGQRADPGRGRVFHGSYRGAACGAGSFLFCVCLSGTLRKPQKHATRERLQIWIPATSRGTNTK